MKKDFNEPISEVQAKAEMHFPQFLEFVNAQNEMIQSGACLLTGASFSSDYAQFLSLVSHVEELWDAACTLFRAKCYCHSLFLAISVLEETGKVGVARFQMVLRHVARNEGRAVQRISNIKRRGNPFYSHPEKHLLVAGAGAIVNSRLDRILGLDRVSEFLADVRSGAVERLRQSALYADLGANGPILPRDLVSDEKARFYLILAGELMAEILGFEPPEWERLLAKVQGFEREIGQTWE